jgi:hypothetical protein
MPSCYLKARDHDYTFSHYLTTTAYHNNKRSAVLPPHARWIYTIYPSGAGGRHTCILLSVLRWKRLQTRSHSPSSKRFFTGVLPGVPGPKGKHKNTIFWAHLICPMRPGAPSAIRPRKGAEGERGGEERGATGLGSGVK